MSAVEFSLPLMAIVGVTGAGFGADAGRQQHAGNNRSGYFDFHDPLLRTNELGMLTVKKKIEAIMTRHSARPD